MVIELSIYEADLKWCLTLKLASPEDTGEVTERCLSTP